MKLLVAMAAKIIVWRDVKLDAVENVQTIVQNHVLNLVIQHV